MNSKDKITYTLSQQKAFDLNRHISVTAGAGSGKTAVLVNRYLKILLEGGVRVSEIVAITFTEKAAAELKERIVRDVNELIEQGDGERDSAHERDRVRSLQEIKEQLTSANIMTIHSFCAKVLREFPVEAGVDAGFSVLQGIEARLALQDAIVVTLKEIALRPDDDADKAELATLLRIVGRNRLQAILGRLVDKRDVVDKLIAGVYGKSDEELIQYWHDFIGGEAKKVFVEKYPIEDWIVNLESVLTIAKGKNASSVANLVDELKIPSFPKGGGGDLEQIDEQIQIVKNILPLILTKSGTIGKQGFLGRAADTSSVESAIEFLVNAAKEIGDTPYPNDDDKLLIDVSLKIFNLYRKALDKYELTKNLAGQLDFEDLQLKVKSLLENEPIRERLAAKYRYIMVDEYQDTNQLQYDILKPLVSDFQTGNLFVVGDQKQSIYNFRGADVRVFERTKEEIVQQTTDTDFEWEGATLESDEMERRGEIHLADNFRLLLNLVDFVNLVFSQIMGSGSESEFHVEYEPLVKRRANDEPGSVELVLLFDNVKRAVGLLVEHAAGLLEETEENIIARRIKRLMADGQQIWIRDKETGQEVSQPVKYGNIAILLRSRTNLKQIESALEKHDIPYIVTGGIGFYQSQEIYDIYNYLQFLLTPQDDVALAGILRAPFFGLSDAQLYQISDVTASDTQGDSDVGAERTLVNFWDKLQQYATEGTDDKRIQRTIGLLNEHLNLADRIPLTSLIRRILNDTAAIGVLAAGPRGEQNLANYEKLLDVARDFERAGFSNLFDFMERLRIFINEEPREGQATTEAIENAVQIMTIHAAKGLEFPIVILPYIGRGFKYDSPPYIDDALGLGFNPAHPDRNYKQSEPAVTQFMKVRSGSKTEAEEKRIFYVATTRARDMLILSGRVSEKRNKPSWMNWLLDALDLEHTLNESHCVEATRCGCPTELEAKQLFKIIKSAEEIELVEEEPEPEPAVIEIPEIAIESLSDEPMGEIFSEEHFTTYAQCPAKFYLKYQLGMPETDFVLGDGTYLTKTSDFVLGDGIHLPKTSDVFSDKINALEEGENCDGTTTLLLDAIVHEALKRVKTPAPKFEVIEEIVDKLLTPHSELNSTEVQELRYATEKHVYNFLTSELAKRAFSSPEKYCEYNISAKLGGHFVTGTIDRLFKNDAGEYEIVVYKTCHINDVEQPEVEHAAGLFVEQTVCLLHAMLVLKLFPAQQAVTTTIFFTHPGSARNEVERRSGLSYSSRYDAAQLDEIEQKFLENIKQMSSGKFEKNTSHCPDCPYAEDGICLL